MQYQKHFGTYSSKYRQFRPDYPQSLYQFLNSLVEEHHLAWDCGAGNGQAAVQLAQYFKRVLASDLQFEQLKAAPICPNILYCQSTAEKAPVQDHVIDLITIAQALHWFDLNLFYNEVNRVLKPNGLIAAWCYSLGQVDENVNKVILKLYKDILGDQYWPIQRRFIEESYQTIPFPFTKLKSPEFFIEKTVDFTQLMGYLQTWSAVKEYEKQNKENPIELIQSDLEKAFGDLTQAKIIRWPIHLLIGRAR